MKVTSVEIFNAKSEQTFINQLNQILIRVNTDEGISGYQSSQRVPMAAKDP